jgi:hypothetical protein
MTDDEFTKLIEGSKPVNSAPVLRTINGMGFKLSGRIDIPGIDDGRHIAVYWFVFFFLPLIPIAVYVVKGTSGAHYTFFRRLRFVSVINAYGWGTLRLYGSAWIDGGITIIIFAVVVCCLSLLFWGIGQVFHHR